MLFHFLILQLVLMFGSFSELFTGWGGSSYYRYCVAYVARLESLLARRCLVIYVRTYVCT